jgi:hypothetical protein
MEYIISDREKKMQRNPVMQFWRFLCLSFRFMDLTCACCEVPPKEQDSAKTAPPSDPHNNQPVAST